MIISQAEFIETDKIPERLRAARRKTGLSQKDFASLGGVTLNTQHRYEGGTLPPVDYLLRIGAAGADWYWILTGTRQPSSLTQEETRLIDLFRLLGDDARQALMLVLGHMRGGPASSFDAAEAMPIQSGLHDRQTDFKGEVE